MDALHLTKKEARRFLLYKQGLIGNYRFAGREGILDFIHQAGCIQFDPIDVCGKNAELVLQSRVKGFKKQMLYSLLYTERQLVDYFDKNLSIFPVENWKYYGRERDAHRKWERSHEEILKVRDEIKRAIRERGALCSADLDMKEKVAWYWSDTKISRAALEHMYFTGELAIHHKKGTVKYYDLIENCIPAEIINAPEPYPDDFEHLKWRTLQRIGSVGLLWNRASDAWLGIGGLKSDIRSRIFSQLQSQNKILEIKVDSIDEPLFCRSEDTELIEYIRNKPNIKKRCEFIAPLDNMLWDRKLIKALFDFEYKWEIYTPQAERRYGYYVLPILRGDSFIGRIELTRDRENSRMDVKNIWREPGIRETKAAEEDIRSAVRRFTHFNFDKNNTKI